MSELIDVLKASEDHSVNFVRHTEGGLFEARYVRRGNDYFIAYVSSQTGCDRACRFCHLTATGQTSMTQASVVDYLDQIKDVLDHHSRQEVKPSRMNVNFMARGEPLLNPWLTATQKIHLPIPSKTSLKGTPWEVFVQGVTNIAKREGVSDVRFNISTIMPRREDPYLFNALNTPKTTIYYSLYSMRPSFRRRWLPKAIDPEFALDILAQWQETTGNDVALHWAFIEGENDDEETVAEIIQAVKEAGLKVKFNAVRYNPYSEKQGRESPEHIVQARFQQLADSFDNPFSRIVPRVGYSIKASCGMFVS